MLCCNNPPIQQVEFTVDELQCAYTRAAVMQH